uniref:Uncharacterized protein n=1 Tax=Arundo donax TaxID=35708 RepID=A0A0A9D6D5_ARUDO
MTRATSAPDPTRYHAASPSRPRPHCTEPRPPLIAVVCHLLRNTRHAAQRRCHLLWPRAAEWRRLRQPGKAAAARERREKGAWHSAASASSAE